MQEIKVGDIVRVVDSGQLYNTYEMWAKRNNLTKWKSGGFVSNGDIFEVVAKDVHTPSSTHVLAKRVLVGLDNPDKDIQVIMGVEGVSLVVKVASKPSTKRVEVNEKKPISLFIERNTEAVITLEPQFDSNGTCHGFNVFRNGYAVGYRASALVAKHINEGYWTFNKGA